MSNGGINVAALGLGGIDTTSIVSQLVSIQQQPANQLSAQQQQLQSAQTTITSFSSTLSALKNAAAALADPAGFTSMAATSSSSAIASTVKGSPAPGQWSVSVSQIAQEQRTLSNGTSSSTTALGLSGDLSIAIGNPPGTPTSISIDPTDTLSDIAGKISSSGLRVQASMVYDGQNYHLLVAGLDTGKANKITFDESGLTGTGYSLGLSDAADNNIQSAQDAQLMVGTVPVTSSTNQVTNAIPGVTLALTQPTTTPATISIASDPSSIQQKVQAFVTAYNTVINNGHTAAGFGTTKASNTMLQGDSGIRKSLDQVESLMGELVPGTSGTYTTLDSVGISLAADGTLTLDSDKLGAALQADPTSVSRLFVTDPTTGSQGVMGAVSTLVDSFVTGNSAVLNAEVNGMTTRSQQMTTQLAAMAARTTAYQTLLTQEFTAMNAAMAKYKQIGSSLTQAFNTNNSSNSSG